MTPSTTNSGWPLPVTAELPLILIVVGPPGCPGSFKTGTPGALPCIRLSGEVKTPLLKSFSLIDETDPVRSLFLAVPYPVTTTSFKLDPVVMTNDTSTYEFPPNCTSCVAYPMDVITNAETL